MIFNLLKSLALIIFLALFSSASVVGQVTWERSNESVNLPVQLFHSTQSIVLPTTETLQKGDIEFEVSHRFIPTIADGSKELFGFDGPANIKLGLSYGITDDLLASISRTNIADNLELIFKYRIIGFENEILPVVIGIRGSGVWNTDPLNGKANNNNNFQYYAQLIINGMINKKLGVGIVPSYLYNSDIYSSSKKNSLTMGINIQYYISTFFSLIAEWNPTMAGYRNLHDSISFGFELETGGHFFKIIATNNQKLNTSQFLAGSRPERFDKKFKTWF